MLTDKLSLASEVRLSDIEKFQGFFSYAHHDAKARPELVEAFTKDLALQVGSRLTNADFDIWRDVEKLRTGDRWDERIGDAVRASQVLIVLLSPKWVQSDYCRKEYAIFENEVETQYCGFDYVFVILARDLDAQRKHFRAEQTEAFDSLSKRQHQRVLASDFLDLSPDQRKSLVEKLADDLVGMIERVRSVKRTAAREVVPPRARKRPAEFNSVAHNIEDVGLVTGAEVVIDRRDGDGSRAVLAHVGFIERLYVQTESVRCEFGVRRFYLSIDDRGAGQLGRIDALRAGSDPAMQYVDFKPAPGALTVCVTAQPGCALGPLPMKPAEGENYLSQVATLPPDADANALTARLSVVLKPEGLFFFGDDGKKPPLRRQKQIAAIVATLGAKDINGEDAGRFDQSVLVSERK